MTTEDKDFLDNLISQKASLREDFKNNPLGVQNFYEALTGCGFEALKKTDVFSLLSEREITHLRRFLSFLFCTGNETQEFIEKNKFPIMIYLIYLTFELTKLD